MLLRKIKTRGFLGHLGAAQQNGNKPAFVELDFTDTDLSLVHGANGVGKSTIWDALMFAFFKEYRGGKKSNFIHLIHDREDKAEISVEFEIDNQIWEIYSEISKKRGGTASVSRRLCLITNGDKATKCENDDAVKDWVQQNLAMSAQTFTSAVLLRQGEADKFLRTKPTARKEILLELLQLDFYRKLSAEATKRSNEHKKTAKRLDEELATTAADVPEECAFENQQKLIDEINTQIEQLNVSATRKQKELGDSQQAEKFLCEIAKIEQLQNADRQFFDRAEEIKQNFNRFRVLETVLLKLEKVWEVKTEFLAENGNLQKSSAEIIQLENDLQQSSEKLVKAIETVENAQIKFDEAQHYFQDTTILCEEFTESLRQIEKLEKLENDILARQNELAPFQEVLDNRNKIERDFQRFEVVRENIKSLLELRQAEIDSQNLETKISRLNDDSQRNEFLRVEKSQSLENLTANLKNLETEKSNLQNRCNENKSDLKILSEKLESRSSLTGEIECPTCGTSLDEHKAKRLANEIEKTKQQIAELTEQQIELKNLVGQNEIATATMKSNKVSLETELEIIKDEITKISIYLENAKTESEDCRALFIETKTRVGDLSTKNLADFEIEFAVLENAPRASEQLEKAERHEASVNAVVKMLREQGNELDFPLDEREKIRTSVKSYNEHLITAKLNKTTAEDNLDAGKQALNKSERTNDELKTLLKATNEKNIDLQKRCQTIREKVERAQNDVSSENAEVLLACEDVNCFETLKTEKVELQKFVRESESLNDAENRRNNLEGKITTWREQLNEIPIEHRRESKIVEIELAEIKAKSKNEVENLSIAEQDLCEMKNRIANYTIKKSEYDETAKTVRLWNKLADAFGKKGLESRIVQAAQETVKQNANKTLDLLSNGAFQIELEDDANGDELQILVRDFNTQNATDKPRQFEYFSGGESLLIAISLAIAIGQTLSGKTAANTLIIDEGFGALDSNRRDLLVNELQRLTREVLQNGRVIVVSHQDDVKEKFNNRYMLSKDDNGFTNVDLFGRM